jgi:hypothetical protein
MKNIIICILLMIVFGCALLVWFGWESEAVKSAPTWYVDARCFSRGATGAFDQVAVKDPSIVYHDGKYHLFFTGVTSAGAWQMGYASATSIKGLKSAKHTFLSKLKASYFCAPQVFYFEPHQKWYLIYQSSIGATCATSANISDPNSWVGPKSLGLSGNIGWDYFVICDDNYAYLFNTPDNSSSNIYCRKTTLANFPTGWGTPWVAITDTFEGCNVYKSLNDDQYYLVVEDMKDNRYYELHTATNLNGPWIKVAEKWASQHNLIFKADHWTDNVSHGEIIRAGVNQKLEINDIDQVDFLIQGVANGNYGEYDRIPWELGIIRNYMAKATAKPTVSPTATPTATPTPTPTATPTITPTPTPKASPSSSYSVGYTMYDWGSGAVINVTLKNNSAAAVNGWTLDWNFAGNQRIFNIWKAVHTQSNNKVTVINAAYNNMIPANGIVSFGFALSYSGANAKPTDFTLNGMACQVQ